MLQSSLSDSYLQALIGHQGLFGFWYFRSVDFVWLLIRNSGLLRIKNGQKTPYKKQKTASCIKKQQLFINVKPMLNALLKQDAQRTLAILLFQRACSMPLKQQFSKSVSLITSFKTALGSYFKLSSFEEQALAEFNLYACLISWIFR